MNLSVPFVFYWEYSSVLSLTYFIMPIPRSDHSQVSFSLWVVFWCICKFLFLFERSCLEITFFIKWFAELCSFSHVLWVLTFGIEWQQQDNERLKCEYIIIRSITLVVTSNQSGIYSSTHWLTDYQLQTAAASVSWAREACAQSLQSTASQSIIIV